MRCQQVIRVLDDYLAGELPPRQRQTFERHLAECPECVAYLSSYRQTCAVVRSVWMDDLDSNLDSVPERLVAAVLAAVRCESQRSSPAP